MKAEINSKIELVEILLYLADVQEKTCQSTNNHKYCSAIDDWFSPYKNHSAVLLTQELILNKNFRYIKPLRAILNFDNLIKDHQCSLHEWAVVVHNFIDDTDFDTFFNNQKCYYNWILEHVNNCDFDLWISFIEDYFKDKPDNFKLIICPIDGNYGFSLERDNIKTSYTVLCMPHYDEIGILKWNYDNFARGIAHEYAHCFVNPVVEANKELLIPYKSFFKSHTNMPSYYNVDYAVINEYFVRAFAIRFIEQNQTLFQNFNVEAEYTRQRECFFYIDTFVKAMFEFETKQQNFSDFYIDNINRILREVY